MQRSGYPSIPLTVAFSRNFAKIMCKGFTREVFFFCEELFQNSILSIFIYIIYINYFLLLIKNTEQTAVKGWFKFLNK